MHVTGWGMRREVSSTHLLASHHAGQGGGIGGGNLLGASRTGKRVQLLIYKAGT